jgi:hypothetical protein
VDLTREHAEDRPVDFCLFLRSIRASAQCGTKLNSSDNIDGETEKANRQMTAILLQQKQRWLYAPPTSCTVLT